MTGLPNLSRSTPGLQRKPLKNRHGEPRFKVEWAWPLRMSYLAVESYPAQLLQDFVGPSDGRCQDLFVNWPLAAFVLVGLGNDGYRCRLRTRISAVAQGFTERGRLEPRSLAEW
jgi:hypothetical protein